MATTPVRKKLGTEYMDVNMSPCNKHSTMQYSLQRLLPEMALHWMIWYATGHRLGNWCLQTPTVNLLYTVTSYTYIYTCSNEIWHCVSRGHHAAIFLSLSKVFNLLLQRLVEAQHRCNISTPVAVVWRWPDCHQRVLLYETVNTVSPNHLIVRKPNAWSTKHDRLASWDIHTAKSLTAQRTTKASLSRNKHATCYQLYSTIYKYPASIQCTKLNRK